MITFGLGEILDLAVVGSGPAGLVTLYEAQRNGLRAVGFDQGPVSSALMRHPTYMRWFSTAEKLELAGFPLLTNEKNPTRREYLRYCQAFAWYFRLEINTYREVRAIIPLDGLFRLEATDRFGRKQVWRARNVAVATGFYDNPRPLGVPGEDLPKVSHRYSESHGYADTEVLVVGAGSSAAEVALELYRAGAHVTVAMRSDRFDTKYWIEPDIENRIREGAIACHRNVIVREILPDEVVLCDATGGEIRIANDFVLAMTGYVPDTGLLERAGAAVDATTKKPALNEYLETTMPGLYVAGTLCAGCDSNTIFVENSREHGARIVAGILRRASA